MITGFSVQQLLDKAIAHGACGVLHKPLDPPKLLAMIDGIKPCGILIADDDRDFVESIRKLLEQNGYKVYVAHDGKEAVERVLANNIDVLMLDLRMPLLSGIEVCLELQQKGRCAAHDSRDRLCQRGMGGDEQVSGHVDDRGVDQALRSGGVAGCDRQLDEEVGVGPGAKPQAICRVAEPAAGGEHSRRAGCALDSFARLCYSCQESDVRRCSATWGEAPPT